uniref:50S ribosomal protein L1 n=1 Tax=Heligmosomoides polygyrus TaxID=6339 RepID=A0A183FCB3_HELPZ
LGDAEVEPRAKRGELEFVCGTVAMGSPVGRGEHDRMADSHS